jgi:uncharacterized repeat protein (TIGR02543 family)
MLKRRSIFIPLVISLVLVLSLLLLGTAGCPSSNKYNLTVSVSPGGSGSVSPSGGSYDPGVTVTITATANSGYVFDYWSGSASGTSPTTTIVMDAHKIITANFKPVAQTYTLTVSVSPSGAGSVSPSGGEYAAGTEVSISATANSGYVFDYWSGSSNATAPNTKITMDSDKNVTANFVAVGVTVLFSDDFSNPNSGDWDVYTDANGKVFYEDGWLHILNYTTASEDTESMLDGYFSDFALEADTKLVDGTDNNWHGVICRLQDLGNYYVCNISADGYYLISRFVDYDQVALTGPTPSSYINTGWDVVNTVRIECVGNSLSLSVNGHLLDTVYDSNFSSGKIGLLATSWEGDHSEIAFDNLVITEP